MINEHTLNEVERVILDLASHVYRVAGLVLTEDDLKCHLFHRLLGLPNMSRDCVSADPNTLANPVHVEVPWFDEDRHLRLRPDVTLTDPAQLSVHRSLLKGFPLPRKGFHFVGDSIAIELKFYRGKTGITRQCVAGIRRDLEKLRRLVRRSHQLSPDTYMEGIVAVFSKYARRCPELAELAGQVRAGEHIRLIIPDGGLEGRRRRSFMPDPGVVRLRLKHIPLGGLELNRVKSRTTRRPT
jgi:hypothetical protein